MIASFIATATSSWSLSQLIFGCMWGFTPDESPLLGRATYKDKPPALALTLAELPVRLNVHVIGW